MPLDLQGENGFLNLAVEAAVGAVEEKSAGKLHGQRAGALRGAAAGDVAPGGLEDAGEIDAPVLLEVLILGGDDGSSQNVGNLVVSQQDAALQSEGADGLAVIGVELGFDDGPVGLEGVNFRQVARIDEEQSGGSAQRDGAQD